MVTQKKHNRYKPSYFCQSKSNITGKAKVLRDKANLLEVEDEVDDDEEVIQQLNVVRNCAGNQSRKQEERQRYVVH
jgi:hypothetical protein